MNMGQMIEVTYTCSLDGHKYLGQVTVNSPQRSRRSCIHISIIRDIIAISNHNWAVVLVFARKGALLLPR